MSNSNSAAPADSTPAPAPATQKRRGRPVDPSSALSQARTVLAGLPADTSRKDAIAAFQASVKNGSGVAVSKDTAAAYYALIKRDEKAAAAE